MSGLESNSKESAMVEQNTEELVTQFNVVAEGGLGPDSRAISAIKSTENQPTQTQSGSLEKMKIRCFQTAADYLSKGYYQKALEQIRYVVEIDPSNSIARDFERKVVDLAMAEQKVKEIRKTPKEVTKTPERIPPVLVPQHATPSREPLSKYTLILIVVCVIALAAGAGYFFAKREGPEVRYAPIVTEPAGQVSTK